MAEGGITRREVLTGGAAALALLTAYRTTGAKSLGRSVPVADHALEPAAGTTVDLNMLVANTTLAWWQDIVKMFNKTSPYTIKPNFSIISNGNAKTQLPAALSSGSAPDISYTLEDFQAAGALVSAGLLNDWSPYAKKYGWKQKYGSNEWRSFYLHSPIVAAVSYDAVPHPFIWYFPSTLKKLGLTVPANRIVSLAQHKSYIQAGQKAGMQGMVIGNHDIWPGSQTMSIICQRTMSAPSLAKLQAAQHVPGDKRRLLARQEHDGRCDLVGAGNATEEGASTRALPGLCRVGLEHRGVHRAGGHDIDPHARWRHFSRQGFGESDDGALGRRIVGCRAHRAGLARRGREVDDVARSPPGHERDHGTAGDKHRSDVAAQGGVPVLVCESVERLLFGTRRRSLRGS